MEKMVVAKPEVKDPAAVEVAVGKRKNTIWVSTYKKPLIFYVNLAKRRMQDYNEVELSALGMAIGNVISVAEFLKDKGYATQKRIRISTIGVVNDNNSHIVQKPKSIPQWQAKVSRLVIIPSVS